MKDKVSDLYNLPESGFVRLSDLLEILPFSAATLWRMVKRKEFPSPIRLAPRVTAWRVSDVREWLNKRNEHVAA